MEAEETTPRDATSSSTGILYLMVGAARRHVLLCQRFSLVIGAPAFAEGCRPYANDMALRVGDDVYYPDIIGRLR